tara:strand:- start:2764 stop:3555 length:792 start_codon:yes stop_codon:yes gene_type:complete
MTLHNQPDQPNPDNSPMQRWKLTVEYHGGPFVGWQKQEHGVSVQGVIEDAMAKFLGHPPPVYVCGRTDAGVHALAQVAHVNLPIRYSAKEVRDATNFHMKEWPVAIVTAEAVDDHFHARLSAVGRAYRYRILNRRARPGLDAGRVWHIPVELNVEEMAKAAKHLLGHHDFTSFRASHCQAKSPMKTLDKLDITRVGDEIWVDVAARSFLHHQVRNMTGTLRDVGWGTITADDMKDILEAKDRSAAGQTAPSDGLYFMQAFYED